MNQPAFNKFAAGDPNEDYNRRMREYIRYLQGRDNRCKSLEADRWEVRDLADRLHSSQEECEALRYSMKNLRYHLRTMFKEGNNGRT